MATNVMAQPQGPAKGTVPGEGPSLTASTGEAGRGSGRGVQGSLPSERCDTSDNSLYLPGPIFSSRK